MSKNDSGAVHKQGRFPPSTWNVCSGCGMDLGGSVSSAKLFQHRCAR